LSPSRGTTAVDTAEQLLRAAHGRVVVALSGSETVEQAYALAKLVRHGTDSHDAVLPEEVSLALDAYRLPLSAIADAQVVAVLGDDILAVARYDRLNVPTDAEVAFTVQDDQQGRGLATVARAVGATDGRGARSDARDDFERGGERANARDQPQARLRTDR